MEVARNIGFLLSGLWLIMTGLIPFLHLSFTRLGTVMACVAIVSGALDYRWPVK